jgi:hypothetical protein
LAWPDWFLAPSETLSSPFARNLPIKISEIGPQTLRHFS